MVLDSLKRQRSSYLMNLEVSQEEVCSVLKDVRVLIRDCLIPRIDQLETELRLLREVTWPVCQSIAEISQLSDTQNKKRFLQVLDEKEIRKLLVLKDEIAKRPLEHSTSQFLREELSHISRTRSVNVNSGTQPIPRTLEESPSSVSTSQGL